MKLNRISPKFSDGFDQGLENFLTKLLCKFSNGLQEYENKSVRKDNNYKIWEYGEITLISLLTNGFLRTDKDHKFLALHEFGVMDSNKTAQGRADLLIQNIDEKIGYLIEAKKYASKGGSYIKWDGLETESLYKSILNQARSYYQEEEDYYKNFSKLYLVGMAFESIIFECPEQIDEWKNYFVKPGNNEYYFLYLSELHNKGLAVYGSYEIIKQ